MRQATKTLGLLIVVVAVLASQPLQVAAVSTSPLSVQITDATYLDLDADGVKDDMYASFSVTVDPGIWFRTSYLYCFLQKPSGETRYFVVKVIGAYCSLDVTVSWYNVITENGLYLFAVMVEVITAAGSLQAYDEIWFDPPEETPGPPLVSIQ
ncbi:MAG: hypothetical protein QXS20_07985 [Candidatus Thorarchaeota archaeon]